MGPVETDLIDRPVGMPAASRSGESGRTAQGLTAQGLLSRALTRAWWALLWERLWPRLALPAIVVSLFLIVSWAGLWFVLPPLGRVVGLALFALAMLASLFPLTRLALPTRGHSLTRVDHGSGIAHRPATAISDALAAGRDDQGSQALWQAHVARAAAEAHRLRAGLPRPALAARDPFAMRALVAILLVATFVAAGGERWRRVAAAFDWRGVVASANYRIDAWATPPNYTGRPPVLLPGIRAGEPVRHAQTIAVPAGSVLVIRATGVSLDVTASGLTEAAPEGAR